MHLTKTLMITGLALSIAPSVLEAQAQSEPGVMQDSEATLFQETVLVTARKRDEAAKDIPIALTVIGDQDIFDAGTRNLADALTRVPSVNILDGGDGITQVSIRGVSSDLGGGVNGYYVDGAPFTGVTVPIYPDLRSYDIDRVEVLRGPQGTLFGEGSMGGTVRFITGQADASKFEARLSPYYSTTQDGGPNQGIRGVVNLPIAKDLLAVRLVATDEDLGGWIDTPGLGTNRNQKDISTYRVKAAFTPMETLELFASGSWYDGTSIDDAAADDGRNPIGANTFDVETEFYAAGLKWDIGPGKFSYTFGQSKFDNPLQVEIPTLGQLDATIGIDVTTHEALYAGQVDKLSFTGGVYARNAERTDTVDITNNGIVLISNLRSDDLDAFAVFGEFEYELTDKLSASVGGRLFSEEIQTTDSDAPPGSLVDVEDESFTPRFALSYDANPNTQLYASAAQGFRSQQQQPGTALLIASAIPSIDLETTLPSDTIWTYEIGQKSILLDGKLTLESAAYYSDWEDRVVRIELVPGANGLAASSGTETWGLEAFALYLVNDELSLQGGLSYIDAQHKDDVPGSTILSGDPVDGVSEFSGNAAATWRKSISESFDFFARVDTTFYTERENTSAAGNLPGDDIFLANARVGLERDDWGLYLFADNLTDEDGALAERTLFGAQRPRPLTVGIELDFKFSQDR